MGKLRDRGSAPRFVNSNGGRGVRRGQDFVIFPRRFSRRTVRLSGDSPSFGIMCGASTDYESSMRFRRPSPARWQCNKSGKPTACVQEHLHNDLELLINSYIYEPS